MRTRLFGATPVAPPVGQRWSPAFSEAWPELEELIDGHLKRPGTAAVSTWEVCAADLARVVVGEAGEKVLIERFSDALVPTLDALQGPHKALPTALAEGRKAGEAGGSLAAATRPLVGLPIGLDRALEEGWGKTVAFLDPVIDGSTNPAGVRAALLSAGARLAEGARAAETTLREELSRLPQATDPAEGLIDPFERWGDVLCRAIEVEIHGGAHALIRQLR